MYFLWLMSNVQVLLHTGNFTIMTRRATRHKPTKIDLIFYCGYVIYDMWHNNA